jgi:hypothetical protein
MLLPAAPPSASVVSSDARVAQPRSCQTHKTALVRGESETKPSSSLQQGFVGRYRAGCALDATLRSKIGGPTSESAQDSDILTRREIK